MPDERQFFDQEYRPTDGTAVPTTQQVANVEAIPDELVKSVERTIREYGTGKPKRITIRAIVKEQ